MFKQPAWKIFSGVLLASALVEWGGRESLAAGVYSLREELTIRHIMDTGSGSIRIARDPRDQSLHYLKQNGDLFRVDLSSGTSQRVYSRTDHSINSAAGLAIGPDGTIYLVGNESLNNETSNRATVMRGTPDLNGQRIWSILARTEPYPRSRTAFDHVFNGIAASPDGEWVFVNSGSRTDHGEEQALGGIYPGVREVPLTAAIFRLPAQGENLLLKNDRMALEQEGFLFAEGLRNAYSLAFDPEGELFATENGPDRDMPEELNWIRQGHHYGFPWRLGGLENPQQLPGYDPGLDKLLDPRFIAVIRGYYHNDPDFPPPPLKELTEPVLNLGPDADFYRDLETGEVKKASEEGVSFSTFTAHRSPLGLVFDRERLLGRAFRGDGFVLSWTRGDAQGNAVAGPFHDPSEDLLHLKLRRVENNYEAEVRRIAGGFRNPIDAELVGNRLYVLEYGGTQGIWEIAFPVEPFVRLESLSGGEVHLVLGGESGRRLSLEKSPNLATWSLVEQFELDDQVVRVSEPLEGDAWFFRVKQE
jgi:hypothetical protein